MTFLFLVFVRVGLALIYINMVLVEIGSDKHLNNCGAMFLQLFGVLVILHIAIFSKYIVVSHKQLFQYCLKPPTVVFDDEVEQLVTLKKVAHEPRKVYNKRLSLLQGWIMNKLKTIVVLKGSLCKADACVLDTIVGLEVGISLFVVEKLINIPWTGLSGLQNLKKPML
jgi:hypothetical protein